MLGLLVQAVQTALPFIVVLCVPATMVGFLAVFLWRRIHSFLHPYGPELHPEEALKVADRGYWGTVVAVSLLLIFHAIAPSPSGATASQVQSPPVAAQSVPCQVIGTVMPPGQPQHVIYGPAGCGQ